MKIFAVLACLFMLLSVTVAENNSSSTLVQNAGANATQNAGAVQNVSIPSQNPGAGDANGGDSIYYSKGYLVDGWLNLTRTVIVNRSTPSCLTLGFTGACGNTGAIAADITNSAATAVIITAHNVGPLDRDGLEIAESLSSVPEGVKLAFDPPAEAYDGGKVAWLLGSLKQGEEKTVSYSFNSMLSPGAVERIPDITVKAQPVELVLTAPKSAYVGSRITLFLRTSEGRGMASTTIKVGTPEGARLELRTDKEGIATFYASNGGNYTYSVSGYSLQKLPSTAVAQKMPSETPLAAAAVTADSQILSSIVKLLPVFAAIFAVAVVMLFLYSFFYSRKQGIEAGGEPASPAQEAPTAPVYTQRFSFGDEVKQEKKIDDLTRNIISSRKKRMSDPGEKQGDGEADGVEAAEEPSEKTVMESALDEEMASLEAEARKEGEAINEETEAEIEQLEEKARASGESANEERGIEETIAELEKIRARLRSKKSAMKKGSGEGLEEALGSDGEDGPLSVEERDEEIGDSQGEEEALLEKEEERPRPPKKKFGAREIREPKPRVLPKGKKIKFSYRGVRKRR